MKLANANLILVLVLACGLTAAATATTFIDYGWEDNGTTVGIYPDPVLPSILSRSRAAEHHRHQRCQLDRQSGSRGKLLPQAGRQR